MSQELLTEAIQHYLREIYKLGQGRGPVAVGELALLTTGSLPDDPRPWVLAGSSCERRVEEPVPPGAYGGVRVLAFAAVTAGAFLLARPDAPAAPRSA